MSTEQPTLDARGNKRSPAATPGYKPKKPPATKGRRFPPDPLPVEDFVKLLGACTPQRPGKVAELSALRLRALIVVLWRTGLRISEALALEERDLNQRDRTVTVRHGKGDRRRIVVMDDWGWDHLALWLRARLEITPGQVFCVLSGPTTGRAMHDSDVRRQVRDVATRAGVRRRVHCHGMRHSHAVDLWREGISLLAVQKQLGHVRMDETALYLSGLTVSEILEPIAQRRAPMMALPLPAA
jgi:site-specific recombinase XerD